MKFTDIVLDTPRFNLELTYREAQQVYDAIATLSEISLRGTVLIDIGMALRDRGFRRSSCIIPAEGMERS